MSTKSREKRDTASDDRLEAELHAAMRRTGFLVPVTEREVAAVEKEVSATPLPPALKNPRRVFEKASTPRAVTPKVVRFSPAAGVDAALARAAREGGKLTPEVERAMRRDRATAEAQADKESERNRG